jgi:hypothetical protein
MTRLKSSNLRPIPRDNMMIASESGKITPTKKSKTNTSV